MSVSDKYNLLTKLTPSKLANATQILSTYHYSRQTGDYKSPGLPFSTAFEPTTSCNLRCPECPSGLRSFSRPTGMLDTDFFKTQINQMKNHLIYLTFYFQGEPYLHDQFLEMVSHASKNKIYTSTSTNAHFLSSDMARNTIESGLDNLIISIDGTTQDTYEAYRVGGKLERVLEGTKNIIDWKRKLNSSTPNVVFQFLVVRHNEHQIEAAKSLSKEVGVDDIRFKTAQIYDYQNGSDLMPENKQYSRYKQNSNGTFELKNPLNDHCWKMWHSCVITWDGKVVPCCFDKDANHEMGDLYKSTLSEIWHSDRYNRFRKSILKSRSEIDICQNCSEGLQVFS